MVFTIQRMPELFGNQIALVSDSVSVGIASRQSTPAARLCVRCIFSTPPSLRGIHSLGLRIGRVSEGCIQIGLSLSLRGFA